MPDFLAIIEMALATWQQQYGWTREQAELELAKLVAGKGQASIVEQEAPGIGESLQKAFLLIEDCGPAVQ